MTNKEKLALGLLADRLGKLASLEKASFNPFNKEEDNKIKDIIKPYMQEFDDILLQIKEVVELSDKKGFLKRDGLDEIIRQNY